MRSTARVQTKNAVVNDKVVKPVNKSEERAENQAKLDALHGGYAPVRASQSNRTRGSSYIENNALTDTPPNDVPNNLLVNYNDITEPEWTLADQAATYQGNGWWEFAVIDGLTTTRSLVQFFDIGNVSVGNTYEIGAFFRLKGAAGTDYRLAIAEYAASSWRGANTSDLDFIGIEDPTPVQVNARRTVTEADSDRIRFAIQIINPPASGDIKIEFRNPYGLLVPSGANIGTEEPSEIP